MEMRAHLTDEEFMQAVRNPGRVLVAHLDLCDCCRIEVGRLRRALDAELLESAPSEDFWQRQRLAIQQRLEVVKEARTHRTPRLAWAALAVAVLLGTLWMNDAEKPATEQVQVDDQELMNAVDHAMQSDVPEALEPASLLAQEIGQSNAKQSNRQDHLREAVDEN